MASVQKSFASSPIGFRETLGRIRPFPCFQTVSLLLCPLSDSFSKHPKCDSLTQRHSTSGQLPGPLSQQSVATSKCLEWLSSTQQAQLSPSICHLLCNILQSSTPQHNNSIEGTRSTAGSGEMVKSCHLRRSHLIHPSCNSSISIQGTDSAAVPNFRDSRPNSVSPLQNPHSDLNSPESPPQPSAAKF